jgi:hypothetical protein
MKIHMNSNLSRAESAQITLLQHAGTALEAERYQVCKCVSDQEREFIPNCAHFVDVLSADFSFIVRIKKGALAPFSSNITRIKTSCGQLQSAAINCN